jgi:hypothetical protein
MQSQTKGDKGDQGDKGDKGDKGDQGDKGDKGDRGDVKLSTSALLTSFIGRSIKNYMYLPENVVFYTDIIDALSQNIIEKVGNPTGWETIDD